MRLKREVEVELFMELLLFRIYWVCGYRARLSIASSSNSWNDSLCATVMICRICDSSVVELGELLFNHK